MKIALSASEPLLPRSTSAPPVISAPGGEVAPDLSAQVFFDVIGLLGDFSEPAESVPDASAGDAPPDGDSATASEPTREIESMSAALLTPNLPLGIALAGMQAAESADAADPAAPGASVDAMPEASAGPAPGGSSRAFRLATLSVAGAMLQSQSPLQQSQPLPLPASGEAAMPGRRPAAESVVGEFAESVAVAKPVVEVAAASGKGIALEPDGIPAVASGVAPMAAPVADSAPGPGVRLPAGAPEQWRRPLLEALGERIRVEVAQRSEHAVIRLDPPMMGHIEIVIRHQAGALQVQLSASNSEVLRQLQNISDSLRQDLAQRQYTDISVQIFAGSGDGSGRRRPDGLPEDEPPGLALAEAEAGQASSSFVLALDRD